MSADDQASRNAVVAHAESTRVMRFSRSAKRIAMEHDSLRWRVSPKDDANGLRNFLFIHLKGFFQLEKYHTHSVG